MAKLQIYIQSNDDYFIRLKDNTDMYLHAGIERNVYYDINGEKDNKAYYEVKPGVKGAAIWNGDEADNFIKLSGYNNIEKIQVLSIIKK